MKSANFDVSHELDEFLMVEKPLTHTKRKANADLDKLKPELRQLEEKYVQHLSWNEPLCSQLHEGSPFMISLAPSGYHITLTTSPPLAVATRQITQS